jgi:glutaredoxin
MNKQTLIAIVLILIGAGALIALVLGSGNGSRDVTADPFDQNLGDNGDITIPVSGESVPVYYYGDTCPYCDVVSDWIDEQGGEEAIGILKKEVYRDQQNAEELRSAAQTCGIPANNIGVPFLFAEGRCLIGAPDIINYLEGFVEESEQEVADDEVEEEEPTEQESQ